MFEHEGIPTKEDREKACIREAVKSISFENSHTFVYMLYHKDKEAATAVFNELKYWIKEQK